MDTRDTADQTDRDFAAPKVKTRQGADGALYLESGHALPDYDRCVGDWVIRWAEQRPDTVFLAERGPDGAWVTLTYAQALLRILDLAGWMQENDAAPDRPVAVLSENSIDHAIVALAAMHVGVPVAPISPAYSLMSSDHGKLKGMVELLDPSLIYVADIDRYAGALTAIAPLHRAEILASTGSAASGIAFTPLSEAERPDSSSPVAAAFARITPDTVAKLLFTSGSTGTPKAVINTQRMLTSNQAALEVLWPFVRREPPVLVDWLPWSHTFGGNFTTHLALRNGGSIYIDEGKPAPGLIEKTIRNIKDIRPTIYFNVPRGYDFLLQSSETDPDLRDALFSMKVLFSAGAALPGSVWTGLIEGSARHTGQPILITAAWGSTETAPLATMCHFPVEKTGNIGVPVPGVSLKLLENAGKQEIRIKGVSVTPGYWRNDAITAKAFDDEGYYIMGDAVRLADPADPEKGLNFDGRVSEDFKLSSGTWVSVGALRIAGIDALAPVAQDIVVTGHDRLHPGFLIFANEAACRRLAGLDGDAPADQVYAHPAVRAHVAQGLARLRDSGGGTSKFAPRARILSAPPNPDGGEITDKAYLNQRQCLANRAADIEALYGDDDSGFIAMA